MRLAILLVLAGFLPSQGMVRLAILIGNNHGLEDEKPLQYATQDARQVHTALTQLGGIDKGQDYLLLDPEVPEVMAAFADAKRKIIAFRKANKQVQLLIYYSGHGSDDALHVNGRKLPLADIRDFFREMEADLKILIADACFSGSLISPKGGSLAESVPVVYQDELKVNGSAILTSSSAGELSQESQELRGSLFTHYFLSALRGAGDADRDGSVTLWEAYNHTLSGMRRKLASYKNVAQNPGFEMNLHGSENVILTRVNLGQAFLTLKNVAEGRYQVVEAVNSMPVAEVTISDPEGVTLALSKGPYLVYGQGGKHGLSGFADLRKSRTVVLGASDFKPMGTTAMNSKGAFGGGTDWADTRTPFRIRLHPRYYPSFPGRNAEALAMDFSMQVDWRLWSASASFGYLMPYREGEGTSKSEQDGKGISVEILHNIPVTRRFSAFFGPRLEGWSVGQRHGGYDFGDARIAGTYATAGIEAMLPKGLSAALSAGPGAFWSYGVGGSLNRDFAVPICLSLGVGF